MVKVFALIDAEDVSSPCRLLFQLVSQFRDKNGRFIIGMFLPSSSATSPAIQEGRRRGFAIEMLSQKSRCDPWPIFKGREVIRQAKVTLLESHGYKAAFVAWCLKRLTGLPWVAFAHGYTSDSENRRMAVYNRLDRWLMSRADRVVAVSGATGQLLQDAGVKEERLRVIPNAIDPQDYQLEAKGIQFRHECGAGAEDQLIGIIGRLNHEKGQVLFLRAFKDVARKDPRAKAVLVGEGPDREMLQMMARAEGVEDRVTFTGYRADISAIYAALDLVVLSSLSEGLPIVLLEAMLHRKPVVTTAVGGVPEVMQGILSKLMVRADDAEALAQTMLHALQNPLLKSQVIEAGARQIAQVFSPKRRAQQIFEVYKELLGPAAISDLAKGA